MNKNIDYAVEIGTNPLIKLQMSDSNLLNTLRLNPDPKLAETLIEKKLKDVGLDAKEIAVLFIRDGLKYPLEKAMQETGLQQDQLDQIYDAAAQKVNNFLTGSNGIVGNLKATFADVNNGINPVNSGGLYTK
jgi:predicted DNA-binding protein (UPF0251 family)